MNDINNILDVHLPMLTRMVAEGNAEALLICGDAGIGKTFSILQALKAFKEEHPLFEYAVIGGDISKIGLYKTLYDNINSLILFDDIDSVLSSDCESVLKNALNTTDERVVSYKKSNRELFNALDMTAEEKLEAHVDSGKTKYPNQFAFKGSCVFVSNKPLEDIDAAIKDRCIGRVDLKFTNDDLARRIAYLIDKMEPRDATLDVESKFHVLQHLYNRAKAGMVGLSLRNFVNAMSYKVAFSEDDKWKEMIDLYLN